MKKPPSYWNNAKKVLSKRDPVLRKVIKKFNKGFLTTRKDPFFSLCQNNSGATNIYKSCRLYMAKV